eukprot:TRINITY_DN12631_c0_g2_i1.p1 TRINITY_DN12631_c0_g2~~TRINITY_DN12631_c0_g2_i1.p1  ORF type:complete len:341 (+),score=69.52 TRINITY_DN12631_c0_g2_i1:161-1183(+)
MLRGENERLKADITASTEMISNENELLKNEYGKLKIDYENIVKENSCIKAELRKITEKETDRVEATCRSGEAEMNAWRELVSKAESRREAAELELTNLKAQLQTKDEFYRQKLKLVGDEIKFIRQKEEELSDINMKAQRRLSLLEESINCLRRAMDEIINKDQLDDNTRIVYLKEFFSKLIEERQVCRQKYNELLNRYEELKEYKKEWVEPRVLVEVMEQCKGLKSRLDAAHVSYEYFLMYILREKMGKTHTEKQELICLVRKLQEEIESLRAKHEPDVREFTSKIAMLEERLNQVKTATEDMSNAGTKTKEKDIVERQKEVKKPTGKKVKSLVKKKTAM